MPAQSRTARAAWPARPRGRCWETAGLLTGETSTGVGFSGDPKTVPAVVAGTQTAAPDAFTLTAWIYLGAGGRLLGFGDASPGSRPWPTEC